MFSESHCHLRAITPEAVEKAEGLGFELLLDAGIDLASSEDAVRNAERFGIVRACVGVHPWYADEYPSASRRIRELAGNYRVAAISETGLDFVGRMTKEWVREERFVDKEVQRATLRAHVALAGELGLPVIVHDRAPGTEVLDILEEAGASKAAIHGFNKDRAYVDRCAKMGVYVSVGRNILREPSPEFVAAVRAIPDGLLLTETDGSTPENLLPVCEAIAKIRGTTLEAVGSAATVNLQRLIGQGR